MIWLLQGGGRSSGGPITQRNVTRSDMVYPLHCAASSGAIQKVKAFLAAGADIHARTVPGGKTALHLAASKSLRSMVRFLTQRSLDHQLIDTEGHTIVHCVSRGERYEPVSVKGFKTPRWNLSS